MGRFDPLIGADGLPRKLLRPLIWLLGYFQRGKTRLGTIDCEDSSQFSISAKVPTKNWPSRTLIFRPKNHDGYSEPIYDSTVSTVVKNSGIEKFRVKAFWDFGGLKVVEPGDSLSLSPKAFKAYRIVIVPNGEKPAPVDFEFTLDRSVTTKNTWTLLAVWSDGP